MCRLALLCVCLFVCVAISCHVAGGACGDKAGAPGGAAAHHDEYSLWFTIINTLRLGFQTQISY